MFFEIKDLTIGTEGKEIVKDLNLKIKSGEVHAIMGHPKYSVKGSMKIDGDELSGEPPNIRAKKGVFLAFQNPIELPGVNVVNILRKASTSSEGNLEKMIKVNEMVRESTKNFGIPEEFGKRDLNVGFSGGEKKRMELLQMKIIEPKLAILDEVESGLDVDGIKTAATAIKKMQDGKRAFLIITHFPRILEHIKPDFVHVMLDGRIVESGGYELAKNIEKNGYEQFKKK